MKLTNLLVIGSLFGVVCLSSISFAQEADDDNWELSSRSGYSTNYVVKSGSCIDATNSILYRHQLPDLNDVEVFSGYTVRKDDLSENWTDQIIHPGSAYMSNGRGIKISNDGSPSKYIVEVFDPVIDEKARGLPVAVDDGHNAGEIKHFSIHFPKRKKKEEHQKQEVRSNLYKYSYSVVNRQCVLNQIDVTLISDSGPQPTVEAFSVTPGTCKDLKKNKAADANVKTACSWAL